MLPATLPLLARVRVRVRACTVARSGGRSVVEMRVVAQELVEERVRLLVHAVVSARGAAGPGARAAGLHRCLGQGPLEAAPHGRRGARTGKGGALLGCTGRPVIARTAPLDAGIATVHLQQLARPARLAVRRPRRGRGRGRWESGCGAPGARAVAASHGVTIVAALIRGGGRVQLQRGAQAPDVAVDGLGLLWACVPLAI